jgi:hypothetical protein
MHGGACVRRHDSPEVPPWPSPIADIWPRAVFGSARLLFHCRFRLSGSRRTIAIVEPLLLHVLVSLERARQAYPAVPLGRLCKERGLETCHVVMLLARPFPDQQVTTTYDESHSLAADRVLGRSPFVAHTAGAVRVRQVGDHLPLCDEVLVSIHQRLLDVRGN